MNRSDDMRKREPAPSWGAVYLSLLAVAGLLWLERRTAMTPLDHTVALLGILMVFFVLLSAWLSTGA
jgi:hypothetical protein